MNRRTIQFGVDLRRSIRTFLIAENHKGRAVEPTEFEPVTLPVLPGSAWQHDGNATDYNKSGGADGVRTRDLLDAIEARSQLRYGPTNKKRDLTVVRRVPYL